MASRLVVILLLLLSLFSTFTFAKPSWKLVEVEDEEGDDNAENQNHKLDDKDDEKDSDEAGNDFQGVCSTIWYQYGSDPLVSHHLSCHHHHLSGHRLCMMCDPFKMSNIKPARSSILSEN